MEATRINYGSDPSQFAELRVPSGATPFPVVIVIHGGFWRSRYGLEGTQAIANSLPALGCATWNIEYRRVGEEGGGWPGTLLDVAHAADHLRAIGGLYSLDLTRIITLGHSAGGHLALWLAARRRVPRATLFTGADPIPIKAAISLAGVCDLAHMARIPRDDHPVLAFMGGTPADFPDRYASANPAELLPMNVPQILFHGDADDRVPVEISREYVQHARAAGEAVEYVELPGAGHFEYLDTSTKVWAQVEAALRSLTSRMVGASSTAAS